MFEPHVGNNCEGCLLPQPPEDAIVRHLLDRISTQEVEILNLRRLDESIQRNTHLFEVLLRKSQEGILLVTPKMMVLRLVHAAFGHSDADVAGQSVLLFIHPDDRDRFQQVFSRLLDGQSRTATCQSRVRNPREIWAPAEIEMTDLLDDPQVQAIVFNYRAI